MIPNRQIDSFLFDDNTNINGDNTFTKYFIPEKEHEKREINQDHLNTNEIPFEKIERYFKKNLKLRNTLKQCYWDRQSLTSPKNRATVIGLQDIIPIVHITPTLIQNILNYTNNTNEEFIGTLRFSINPDSSVIEYREIITGCPLSNLTLNVRDKYQRLQVHLRTAYSNVKQFKHKYSNIQIYDNIHINFSKFNDRTSIKLSLIVPNVNLIFNPIKNISLSSTPLTKYLVGKIKNEFNTSNAGYGFLTMSQQHRLITLLDDYDNLENSKCLKQILFGIWINLRNEKIQKDEKGNCNLDELISKHKSLIYSRCLNYLFRTTKIETGYSPSPDEGVFLLVVFLNKTQVFLEVKLSPNEKEKHSSPYNDNRRFLFEGLSNNWLIIRKTIPLGKDIPDYLFDLSRDKSLKVSHVCDYIKTLSNRSQSSGRDSTARNKNFKDPLKELFEDDIEDSCALNAYNLPTPFKDDSKVKFASNQMQSHYGSGNPKLNNLYGKENSNRSHKDFSQSQSLSLTNYVNEGLGSQVSKQTTREEFRTIQPNHHKKVMSLHNATSLNTNVTHTFNNPSKRKTFQHHNNSGSSLSYSQTNSNWKNPCNFNEMKNAYEIICDQAKSIQELQEKVLLLTNQLNLVSSRLKSTGSFCPNCSGKEKIPSVVAVNSTDTSNENKSSRGKNNLSIQHQQNSNQLIRNYSSPCNDDMKFDNFLNENSINFPKQFLDIDSKQFESNLGIDNFNEGNNMSINVTNGDNKHHSVSGINFAERNYQLMKNANIFNDMFNDSLSHNLISNDLLSKASLKLNTQEEQNVKPLNVISPINANINATSIDVDVTTNSNDPSTQRYFLKVPSMIRRSNSSLYHAEDNISSRKKSNDKTDMTIRLPKIIFNESLGSFEEEEGEI